MGLAQKIIYKLQREDKERSKEICQEIHDELKNELELLVESLQLKTIQFIVTKRLAFKHIYMNYDVYDSYVNTNEFNKIDYTLINPIQGIYKKIKFHNQYVKTISNTTKGNVTRSSILELNRCEVDLKNEILPIIIKLTKYLGIKYIPDQHDLCI